QDLLRREPRGGDPQGGRVSPAPAWCAALAAGTGGGPPQGGGAPRKAFLQAPQRVRGAGGVGVSGGGVLWRGGAPPPRETKPGPPPLPRPSSLWFSPEQDRTPKSTGPVPVFCGPLQFRRDFPLPGRGFRLWPITPTQQCRQLRIRQLNRLNPLAGQFLFARM